MFGGKGQLFLGMNGRGYGGFGGFFWGGNVIYRGFFVCYTGLRYLTSWIGVNHGQSK